MHVISVEINYLCLSFQTLKNHIYNNYNTNHEFSSQAASIVGQTVPLEICMVSKFISI